MTSFFNPEMPQTKAGHVPLLIYGLFCLFLAGCLFFWNSTKKESSTWGNVPSAPSVHTASMSALGDHQTAYRLYGYFLQNLGNTGGDYRSLQDYDYATLEDWFMLENQLNDRSDFVPMLAAYYFGAISDMPEKTAHVVNYLAVAGEADYPQKWRWLAQAVYQARYNQKDLKRALFLAEHLAAFDKPVAVWAKQLPAFIQLEAGNKQAAYDIMVRILASGQGEMHPNEINFMRDFICSRVLDKSDASRNELCKNIP